MKNIVELPRKPRKLSQLLELLHQCETKEDYFRAGFTEEEEQLIADSATWKNSN